jgi:hypothetical protein
MMRFSDSLPEAGLGRVEESEVSVADLRVFGRRVFGSDKSA